MKKLMIAAAAVALAGVTFADCDYGTPMQCGWAYRIKLAGKTVTGKILKGSEGAKATCDYELNTNCWAKAASYRVAGYLYGGFAEVDPTADCCDCNKFDAMNTIFWDATKTEVKFDAVAMPVYEVLRNSGAKDKAQILITLDGLNLAGFGVFNPKTRNLKSASGFFAGALAAPECSKCDWEQAMPAQVFQPCLDDDKKEVQADATAAIAFGRWSLTYKADKVAAIRKNGTINAVSGTFDALTPAKFTVPTED